MSSHSESLSLTTDLAQALTTSYPPLARYCPNLATVSAPQALFLLDDGREAFYGGAAGGGKSDALLMAALMFVDRPGYRALILRRTFAQLSKGDALIPRSHEWMHGKADWNEQKRTWTFPSGATLEFGHVEHENSKYDYQGAAFQFIGLDELTQFTESQYDYIGFSRARRVHALGDVPVRTRATSNPGGEGHGWVKRRFITGRKPGVQFVPARVNDNPGLDVADYIASLAYLGDELRRQLLDGDWEAFEGAAFELRREHLIDAFTPGNGMERFESADYGLNGAPWLLWQVDFEGNLIAADMLYERDLLPSQLAPLVVAKRANGWHGGGTAWMDPSVWHRTGQVNKWGAPAMLADEFRDNGVPIRQANNDPRAGLIRLRELLRLDPGHPFPSWHENAGQMGAPRLYFVKEPCRQLIEELSSAPLQPIDKPNGGEVVSPAWESQHGHAVAAARYGVMTRPSPSEKPYEPLEDPRAEMLRRLAEKRTSSKPSFQVV